jgi:hypothetical protein
LCDWFLSEMTVSIDSNLFELGDSSVSTSKPKRGADRVISHFITVHSFDKGYVMLKFLSHLRLARQRRTSWGIVCPKAPSLQLSERAFTMSFSGHLNLLRLRVFDDYSNYRYIHPIEYPVPYCLARKDSIAFNFKDCNHQWHQRGFPFWRWSRDLKA